jgi:hypothetical protein
MLMIYQHTSRTKHLLLLVLMLKLLSIFNRVLVAKCSVIQVNKVFKPTYRKEEKSSAGWRSVNVLLVRDSQCNSTPGVVT